MADGAVTIKSLDRALEILDVLYIEGNEMGIAEISRKMNMHQSTIYRALVTLENRGYVYQNEDTLKYGLGMKLYAIGMKIGNNLPLINVVKPIVKELSAELLETINVCVLDSDDGDIPECIVLYQESPMDRMLGMTQIIGAKSECYYSAAGKVLLAFSDTDYSDKYKDIEFVQYTKNTIMDADRLMDEIVKAKAQGYAVDNEEREPGSFCIACPILDSEDKAIASISISGPKERVLEIGKYNVINTLKDACTKISKML